MKDLLGLEAKDKVSGFKGTVTGVVFYLTGCNQVLISAKADKTGNVNTMWVDVQRVEVTSKKRIVLDNGKTPGHDVAPPVR